MWDYPDAGLFGIFYRVRFHFKYPRLEELGSGFENRSDIDVLINKSSLIEKARNLEKGYLMISRSSFTPSCIRQMDEIGIMHWDCDRIRELVFG
jgi:hypothetical protein